MNKYINPFHADKKRTYYYENNHPVYLEHAGCTVYRRFDYAFDIVISGICVAQRRGVSKESLERIANGSDPYAINPKTMQRNSHAA